MYNVISLQEMRIKKKINQAYEDLKEVRTMIAYGHYERVTEARELENLITGLESDLIKLIESDSF